MNNQTNKDTISNNFVKGMTKMKFLNPTFKNKKILDFAERLIDDYEYSNYADLSQADKEEFAATIISVTNDMEFLFVQNTHEDIASTYAKALSGTIHDDENFLIFLKQKTVEYYDDVMESVFNHVLDERRQELNNWLDYVSKYGDPDHHQDDSYVEIN